MGRDRRAHDRKPGAPRARVGAVLPCGIQERHRRQRAHRGGRHAGRARTHHFLAVTKAGSHRYRLHAGNADCHIILRGGKAPNYDAASVEAAWQVGASTGLADLHHDRLSATATAASVTRINRAWSTPSAEQIAAGDSRIGGVMVESHLNAGRQDLVPGKPLVYGQSITDACIDWDASVKVLDRLAKAVVGRRAARGTLALARSPARRPDSRLANILDSTPRDAS